MGQLYMNFDSLLTPTSNNDNAIDQVREAQKFKFKFAAAPTVQPETHNFGVVSTVQETFTPTGAFDTVCFCINRYGSDSTYVAELTLTINYEDATVFEVILFVPNADDLARLICFRAKGKEVTDIRVEVQGGSYVCCGVSAINSADINIENAPSNWFN